jgi:protein phosphatase
MRFSVYQESKKGGRRVNQDRMGYLYTRDSLLMLVADGMGGHARGEVASQITLQTLASIYQRDAKPLIADPVRFLEEAVLAAHRELHRYRAEHSLPEAPRTTLVACIVQQGVAIWAHVGDSRLYMIRGGRILERTIDHSRVHHLIQGLIRPRTRRITRNAIAFSTVSAPTSRPPSKSAGRSRCAMATRCCCARTGCGDR